MSSVKQAGPGHPNPRAHTGGDSVSVGLSVTLMLGLLSAIGPLSSDMHLPGLPQMAESLNTSDALVASTVTVAFAGFAVGQLIVGGISDRFGRRGPLMVCLALFTLSGAACAMAPSIEFLLVARFIQGLCGAGGVVSSRAAVRDYAQGSASAKLYSQLAAVAMIAPVVAPILGGLTLQVTTWRGLFWALTAISFAIQVAAFFLFRESLPPEKRQRGKGQIRLMWRVVRHRGFGPHLVMCVCQGTVLVSYLTMSSLFYQREYGVQPQTYSYIFAAGAAGMMLGHMVNIRIGSRWGALAMLTRSATTYWLSSIGLLIAIAAHAPLWLVIVLLWLTVMALAPSMSSNMALAMIPFGAAAGTASALLGATQQMAGAVFPSVAVGAGSSGTVMAATMVAASTVAVIQVYAFVRPSIKRGDRVSFV